MRCSLYSNSVTIQLFLLTLFCLTSQQWVEGSHAVPCWPQQSCALCAELLRGSHLFQRQVKIPVLLTRGSSWPWSFSVTRVAGVFYNGLMTARTSSWFEASSSHRSIQPWYKEQCGPSYSNSKASFQNLLRFVAVWLYFHCRGNSGSFHTLSISCIPNIHL